MKIRGLVFGVTMLLGACGYAGNVPLSATLQDISSAVQDLGPRREMPLELQTDDDIKIRWIRTWIDLMPGFGYVGGPHTRAEVTFTALNFGCTVAEDFVGRFTESGPDQFLTIRRMKADTCGSAGKPAEFTVSIYGTYRAASPIRVNGLVVPTEERLIF